MNGYYTGKNAYTTRQERSAFTRAGQRADRVFDVLLDIIAWIVGALRDRTVRTVLRYSLVAVCFFCFIGLIGGIEQGLISIGGGIALGLFLIFVEILCLK
jgi:hypothetical protein